MTMQDRVKEVGERRRLAAAEVFEATAAAKAVLKDVREANDPHYTVLDAAADLGVDGRTAATWSQG